MLRALLEHPLGDQVIGMEHVSLLQNVARKADSLLDLVLEGMLDNISILIFGPDIIV